VELFLHAPISLRSVLPKSSVLLSVSLWAKGLNAKDIHKEIFTVYGGKCLSRKAVHNWVEKFSQGRWKVADDETVVQKWLRQPSKDFYAAGFDVSVKRWDKCINVGGGYVEK
jgi:hypothetical protein